MSLETEKELFKSRIRTVLVNMKEKYVSEKDFKKAYHAEYNQNINVMIDKFDAGNVYNFLRFQCQSICECQVHWGETRIHLLQDDSPPNSSPPDSKKKKHKKTANLPKVNNPRVGIINATSFPKLNPQGFNKGKPKQEYKPLTSLPFYKSNYSAPTRPASQLAKFKDNIAGSGDELEDFPTLTHFGSMGGPINGAAPIELGDFANVLSDGVDATNLQEAPKVGNPFDFPALPKKEEDPPAEQYEYPDSEYEDDFESEEEVEEPPPMNKLLKTKLGPAASSSASIVEEIKAARKPVQRFEVDLDDAIFRCCFPPVVEDPNFKIPSPLIHFSPQETAFDVHVSTVQSPHKFYFHYGDQDLFMLMNKMEKFYSQLSNGDLVMSVKSIRVGLVVAAKFDNTWHRAEVTTKPDAGGYVPLFLLDFGSKIQVHISSVCYLPIMFTYDPVKALRGAIIDIRPKYNADKWNPVVNESFFGMVSNQKLKATIRRYRKDDNEYDVQLCVCYNMVWHNIGQLLVQRGFAAVKEVVDTCAFGLPLPISA